MFTSYQNYFKMGEKETFHQSRAVGISGIGEKIYDQMNYPADIHLNISVEFDELFGKPRKALRYRGQPRQTVLEKNRVLAGGHVQQVQRREESPRIQNRHVR